MGGEQLEMLILQTEKAAANLRLQALRERVCAQGVEPGDLLFPGLRVRLESSACCPKVRATGTVMRSLFGSVPILSTSPEDVLREVPTGKKCAEAKVPLPEFSPGASADRGLLPGLRQDGDLDWPTHTKEKVL